MANNSEPLNNPEKATLFGSKLLLLVSVFYLYIYAFVLGIFDFYQIPEAPTFPDAPYLFLRSVLNSEIGKMVIAGGLALGVWYLHQENADPEAPESRKMTYVLNTIVLTVLNCALLEIFGRNGSSISHSALFFLTPGAVFVCIGKNLKGLRQSDCASLDNKLVSRSLSYLAICWIVFLAYVYHETGRQMAPTLKLPEYYALDPESKDWDQWHKKIGYLFRSNSGLTYAIECRGDTGVFALTLNQEGGRIYGKRLASKSVIRFCN